MIREREGKGDERREGRREGDGTKGFFVCRRERWEGKGHVGDWEGVRVLSDVGEGFQERECLTLATCSGGNFATFLEGTVF